MYWFPGKEYSLEMYEIWADCYACFACFDLGEVMTHKVLPSRKQNKSAIHKVLASVRNHHVKQAKGIKTSKKADKQTGLVK